MRVVYGGGAQVAGLIAATNGGAVAVKGNIYTIMGATSGAYTPGSIVLATSVQISNARKIALDARGNIYLADNGNNVIWFEDATTGYMRVIAGTVGSTSGGAGCGLSSPIGDGCQATLATLSPNSAMGVGVDALGNVFVSDSGECADSEGVVEPGVSDGDGRKLGDADTGGAFWSGGFACGCGVFDCGERGFCSDSAGELPGESG